MSAASPPWDSHLLYSTLLKGKFFTLNYIEFKSNPELDVAYTLRPTPHLTNLLDPDILSHPMPAALSLLILHKTGIYLLKGLEGFHCALLLSSKKIFEGIPQLLSAVNSLPSNYCS